MKTVKVNFLCYLQNANGYPGQNDNEWIWNISYTAKGKRNEKKKRGNQTIS